jgi:AraC-like DNA-binding protein
MSDFASAAMLRLLHAGMRRMGLQSPAQQWLEQATVPLDAKQQLVGQVLRERGIEALLQLGQGLQDVHSDSLMPLLIHPGEPMRVLQMWLRLERYLHSKHRIEQTILTEQAVRHRHVSIKAGSEPSAAEDLVVIGVLIALLQNAACPQVKVTLASGLQLWPWQDQSTQQTALRDAFEKAQTHEWRIQWATAGVDRVDVKAKELGSEEEASGSLSARIQHRASQTVGEALTLEEAAHWLGQSTRSLQRKLKLEGTRYVDIIASARAERASHLLSHKQPSLAEIGFACGYTDQAHFCRDFKRRVGMSPLRYREHALAF